MAIGVSVTIEGLRAFTGRFARYSEVLRSAREQEIETYAPKFVALLSKYAPVGATGDFSGSFRHRIRRPDDTHSEVRFVSIDPLARFKVGPTKPHTISAREGSRLRRLRFPFGTRVIFAKTVKHPGTKFNPFVERAFLVGGDEFYRVMQRAGAKVAVYLSGKGVEI